ncbi:MAG TPA: DALR anticodon-binding domain-containing protein [Allocoleopsis sp.]
METKVAKNTSNCRLLYVNLLGSCAAIEWLLQQQIVVGLSGIGIKTGNLHDEPKLVPETIPMHRVSDRNSVMYRSAIALKLSPHLHQSAFDIANQLVASFPNAIDRSAKQMVLELTVEVESSGWINFWLSDRTLATWLQYLIQVSPGRGLKEKESNPWHGEDVKRTQPKQLLKGQNDSHTLFPIQYAHARCCSLLRLAHQYGLVQLTDADFKTANWQFVEPNPIPWLNEEQGVDTAQRHLRLGHPAERRLLAQLLEVQDEIASLDRLRVVKLASALSQEFEQFYSSCRIWGEVNIQTPKLAQARLGLIAVTQKLLRSLLQDQLGVSAPVEL